MQIFASELSHSYASYSFGYCNYAVIENLDELNTLYSAGYLPYSGAQGIVNVFYMARSVRIPLNSFDLTSENRRIYNKFSETLKREIIDRANFDVDAPEFRKFCLNYFANRHGETIMPADRLTHILHSQLITHIAQYKHENKIVGYVLIVATPELVHFWYSFYDLAYAQQSLGLWLMIDIAQYAQTQGSQHYYVGTAYGAKGLYKTNFNPIEYWNGHAWVNDRAILRERCKTDDERNIALMDEWKTQLKDYLF